VGRSASNPEEPIGSSEFSETTTSVLIVSNRGKDGYVLDEGMEASVTLFRLNTSAGKTMGNEDFGFSFLPECSTSEGDGEGGRAKGSVVPFVTAVELFVRMLTGRVIEL
jgi:hypothetical protein